MASSSSPTATAAPSSKLTLLCVLEGHTDRVWHCAMHPTRNLLATCSSDKTVRLWAPNGRHGAAGEWVCTGLIEDFTARTVRCSAWSPDGRFLACASFDGTVSVWTLSTPGSSAVLEHVAVLEGHDNEVKGVAWSPTGSLLATCSRDKSVWLWEYDERDAEFECAAVLHGHAGDVKAVKWHPTRELLLSASYDDTVRAWGESEGDADWLCTQTLEGHKSTVWNLAFSPDGSHVATVSDDCSMCVWDAQAPPPGADANGVVDALRWELAATLPAAHSRSIFGVDWSPPLALGAATATVIATCGADDAIHLFTAAPQHLQPLSVASSSGAGAVHSGVGATAEEGGAVDAKLLGAAAALLTPPGPYVRCGGVEHAHASDVNCVLWHPRDRGLLFSAGDDSCVRVWRHAWTTAAAAPSPTAAPATNSATRVAVP